MIHFTCDGCGRSIDPDCEVRFVVRMECYASLDVDEPTDDEEVDHLQEIEEILERLDGVDNPEVGEEVYQQARYDLCGECRRRFLQNPLGRSVATNLKFSNN
ncbi:hypothetical protein Mal64_35830 [Pseudobythopirellula maris]|uniref:Uncharacterized protein n=1 Tax=Pseudobythopirellula maris TaxID=2527991 RepID=A0A5C5ZJW7_9BACT|nr:hypothetical protein [Pseudobythopirellula maris]TWT86753.1 hypothetical protein Mal64_35830 [Pseudobythopirellula maris]